jgi:hypothetical protein
MPKINEATDTDLKVIERLPARLASYDTSTSKPRKYEL